MPTLDPRAAFSSLARKPDPEIDLARAALVIAAEEYPDLDVGAYLERLDVLGRGARRHVRGAGTIAARVAGLVEYLGADQGFAGNREHYEDPRNSFFNDVLDRRVGIPISLALVYMEVGRRLDLAVRGIGFPGHFLAKCECQDGEEIIVDPFFARVITRAECEERLRSLTHSDVSLRPELHLRAAQPREILVRMLTNLKQLYVHSEDWGRALGCSERILLLAPEAPLELRDRGLLYERLDCFGAAATDFARFLELAPEDASCQAVRRKLALMRGQADRLH